MTDNSAMPASLRWLMLVACQVVAASALLVSCSAFAARTAAEVDSLRQKYPAASIDSVTRADEALGETAGAKERVDKDFKATARDCVKTILVNDCLDRARGVQRQRLDDINAVELEANRYKRRDRADRIDADRAQREAERRAHAPADAEQRAKNRKSFEDKQVQSTRDTESRAKADARKTQSTPRKPSVRRAPSAAPEVDAKVRAKNADDYANKVKEVEEHQDAIQRRLASKAADRKRRADAKAAKEGAARPPALPAGAAPKT